MKATGMVRRIDDLGRIVIPKEIRKTLRMKEGEPIEFFVDHQKMILKKYSPIVDLEQYSTEYAKALFETFGHPVLVADRDKFVSVAGVSKKDFLDHRIGHDIKEALRSRDQVVHPAGEHEILDGFTSRNQAHCITPIISDGNLEGCIVMFGKDETTTIGEAEKVACKVAVHFIGKQLTS